MLRVSSRSNQTARTRFESVLRRTLRLAVDERNINLISYDHPRRVAVRRTGDVAYLDPEERRAFQCGSGIGTFDRAIDGMAGVATVADIPLIRQ